MNKYIQEMFDNNDCVNSDGTPYPVIASVSGGKDSTAMCLYLKEMGVPYTPMFMDTGWESAESYRYLTEELPEYIGPITTLRATRSFTGPHAAEKEALALKYEARLGHYSAMIRWCIYKNMFPSRKARWCTEKLKLDPMRAYLDTLDYPVINAVGIRGEESAARAKLPAWEMWDNADTMQWRPLHSWTYEMVIGIHQRHGVRPNRMYLADNGVNRVGCWPCIFCRKAEIKQFGDSDPERVRLMEDLEADILVLFNRMRERNGKPTADEQGWFIDRMGRTMNGWPIRKVLAWANTSRGGRQHELFAAAPRDRGCMRWGMCDTGTSVTKEGK